MNIHIYSLERDFSIGQYFQRRCEDVTDMIPQKSPRKIPTALLAQPASVSSEYLSQNLENNIFSCLHFSETRSDLSKKSKHLPEQMSIMSVSQIALHLGKSFIRNERHLKKNIKLFCPDNHSDSPRTLAMKLLNEKEPKSSVSHYETTDDDCLEVPTDTLTSSTNTTISPLADILYITKPLPLSTNTSVNMHSSSVNILKVEEFIGDTNKLLKVAKKLAPSQRHLQNKYSELTPTKNHIVLKSSHARQEASAGNAARTLANKENSIGFMLSDTISCTDSVFEISCPEPIKVPTIQIEEIASMPLDQTPDLSHRKRTRQSPPRSPGVAQLVEAPPIMSPFNNKHPPLPDGKTHVLQSKSRLTGAEKSPRNHRKPQCLPFSAASTSREQASRTPSPNSDRSSSVFSSPPYCSSKAELRVNRREEQNDGRIQSASPTLLTQCSSQCSGSTNDLNSIRNEIAALKSSHAEVCWESIKLRKTASKSFTIKNMSHRKLTLKMEIIGPGFQVRIYLICSKFWEIIT